MRVFAVIAVSLSVAAAGAVAILLASDGSGPSGAVNRSGNTEGLYRGSEPPAGISLPAFKLRNYTRELVDSKALRQKVVLITFLESKCKEACPFIAGQIGRTLTRLGDAERSHVIAIGISTHPIDDTPARVRAFLRRERAEGKLKYLVGSEQELRPVWTAFQILPAFDSHDAEIHSAPVRIYQDGTWVATLHTGADLTTENLLHDVRVALTDKT